VQAIFPALRVGLPICFI